MISLNIVKPISRLEKAIGKKCGWKNIDDIPVKKNIIPDSFIGNAKLESEPLTIGTRLNSDNFEVLETIMGNNKLFRSPFVKTNLTELLDMGKTNSGARLVKTLLSPENIDKIETQRRLVKSNPKAYLKDRDVVKYITTPAGLNSVFSDVNILKAAAVFDAETLDKLFRMDITTGKGKKILDTLGNMDETRLKYVKDVNLSSKKPEKALEYLELAALSMK